MDCSNPPAATTSSGALAQFFQDNFTGDALTGVELSEAHFQQSLQLLLGVDGDPLKGSFALWLL